MILHFHDPPHLIASCTRSLLILLQTKQQLPEPLLASTSRTTLRALPAQVDQFRNALPAGATGTRIFPLGEELLGLAAGLRNALLLLGVVVLVEVVDVLLGGLDGLLLLQVGLLGAVLQGEIAALAPLRNDFGLFFVGGVGLVGGLVGGRRAGDSAAWSNALRVWLGWNYPLRSGIIPHSAIGWRGKNFRIQSPPRGRLRLREGHCSRLRTRRCRW